MILGNFDYKPVLNIGNSIIEIESFLEILGVYRKGFDPEFILLRIVDTN